MSFYLDQFKRSPFLFTLVCDLFNAFTNDGFVHNSNPAPQIFIIDNGFSSFQAYFLVISNCIDHDELVMSVFCVYSLF